LNSGRLYQYRRPIKSDRCRLGTKEGYKGMNRISSGGIGALAFFVLFVVGVMMAAPPGGTYKASDATKYLQSGHRPAVIAALYLVVLASAGLLFLLRRLHGAIEGARAQVFWALSVAGVTAIVAGFAVVAAVPIAEGVGGKDLMVSPAAAFTISEMGWAILAGAGFTLVGLALLTLVLGPSLLPAWVRWTTLAGAVGFAAGLAWFPLPLAGLWLLVTGVWLLRSDTSRAPEPATATA
jgi:hypothetical protein